MGIIIRPGTGANQIAHSDLLNRGAADSHPQTAITGLASALNSLDGRIGSVETYGTRITAAEGDIASLESQQNATETTVSGLSTTVSGHTTAIAGKADTGHTHDDRYYTEAEVDALIAAGDAGTELIKGRVRSYFGL